MKYIFTMLLISCIYQNTNAQIYEAGIFAGANNFIGDVGATNYISPNQIAFGGILKWNRSPRHSYRLSFIYAEIEGKDAKSDDPRRQARNYNFNNNILEISGGIEFTFLDFDLHDFGTKATPYLYTGITAANHDNYYFNSSGDYTQEETNSWAFGIPMALGFKTNMTDHIILGIEIGARYTFSDELDGSVPDAEELESFSFGNINSNDWYVFSGVTLTYTFGRKPCYCNF